MDDKRKKLRQKNWSQGTPLGYLGSLKSRNQRFGFSNLGFPITLIVAYITKVVTRLEEFLVPTAPCSFLCRDIKGCGGIQKKAKKSAYLA